MATKSRKKTAKGRHGKKKSGGLLPWLIGAGIVLLIAVPSAIRINEARNLPGEHFRSQGNVHVNLGAAHPAYNSNPPTSGWHTPNLAPWQSYDYIVPDERLIHNMEDGGVILWYQMGTPEENAQRIAALETAVSQAETTMGQTYRRVVIAPREDMPTPYAMTAWTRLERLESIDQEAITAFIDAFEGIDHHVAGVG